MHILIVTHYYEPNEGSSSDQYTRLSRIWQAQGHRVTVLTTQPHYPQGRIHEGYRGKPFYVEIRGGVRVIYSWLWATPSSRISRRLISQASFMLSAVLRGAGISAVDVVLIEAQPMLTGLVGRLLAEWQRVPYVLNVSDLWPDHLLSVGAVSEGNPAYRVARALVDAGYRGAASIWAMSPAWAREIETYLQGTRPGNDPDKLFRYFRGVDLTRFRPHTTDETRAFREKYGLGDAKLVTHIGTYATQYDVNALVDVAAHFAERDPVNDVRFVLMGTGSLRDQLQQRLQAAALPNVTTIDWVPHSEIPQAWAASQINYWAMRDADLYLGTIPARLYEAFASGVPVAAANGGETAQIIAASGGGVAVPPADIRGLVQAIAQLLDDDAFYKHASQAARAYAESHFDFYKVAAQQLTILQAVAQR
jgi:glycosyltransferase involved in cell wall biosynthesis